MGKLMLLSPHVHAYEARRIERELAVSHAAFGLALEALLGRMDVEALAAIAGQPPDDAMATLQAFVGPLDFTLFQKLDHGGLLSAFTGKPTNATTYVFGNALIAIEMTKHDPRVGLYVPLRLFVHEVAPGRVQVTYDLPSATLGQFGSAEVDGVAHELDAKVVRLIDEAAKRAAGAR
jgi:uncharacterized protein (DUF302 family)